VTTYKVKPEKRLHHNISVCSATHVSSKLHFQNRNCVIAIQLHDSSASISNDWNCFQDYLDWFWPFEWKVEKHTTNST